MPEVNDIEKCSILFLYTEIGRGHPTYIDGIIEMLELKHSNLKFHRTNVFKLSTGLSLSLWKLIKVIYYIGARGGVISNLYNRFRKSVKPGNGNSLLVQLLGKKIIKHLRGFSGIIIVAHPILAQILGPRFNVVYQHGELVVPDEAMVMNCLKIFVPLKTAFDKFKKAGIPSDNIWVVGQCIENCLILNSIDSITKRLERLKSAKKLHAAIFSSGANPPSHISKIIMIADSLIDHGHKVTIFTGNSVKFRKKLIDHFSQNNINISNTLSSDNKLKIIFSENRKIENESVSEIFPQIDFFVAPAHERTNWCIGLGIPQFILCPHFGSFAPLNAQFALKQGVAIEIKDNLTAQNFSQLIDELKISGELERMIINGQGRHEINGFSETARLISSMNP